MLSSERIQPVSMETQYPLLEGQEPRDDEAIVNEKDTTVLLRLRSGSFTAPLLSPKYSFLHSFSSLSHLVLLLMSLGTFCLVVTAFWPNCSQCACGDGPWCESQALLLPFLCMQFNPIFVK